MLASLIIVLSFYYASSFYVAVNPSFTALKLAKGTLADPTVKNVLLEAFDGVNSSKDDIFIDPATLTPLIRKQRLLVGNKASAFFFNPTTRVKYPVVTSRMYNFYDFTIKAEIDKPIWSSPLQQTFNLLFFQSPILSSVYERGYRQNFENFGFPGFSF